MHTLSFRRFAGLQRMLLATVLTFGFALSLAASSSVIVEEYPIVTSLPEIEVIEDVTDCDSYGDGYADGWCAAAGGCSHFAWVSKWFEGYNQCQEAEQ